MRVLNRWSLKSLRSLMAGAAGVTVMVAGAVLVGCGGGSSTTQTPIPARVELTPACSDPAPLEGDWDPVIHGYFVVYVEGTTAAQVLQQTPLLAAKYGFTPIAVYETVLRGFAADLTPQQAASLRCEPTIGYLSYGQGGTFAGGG